MSNRIFFIALAALLSAGPAAAQLFPQPAGQVTLTAETERLDNNAHTLAYDGTVEILQNDDRLRCDHAVITQVPGSSDIDTVEATGNIYYVTKTSDGLQSVVRGDKAVYTRSADTIVITGGQVILTQGQNVMTGTRLVVQIGKGITTFDKPDGKGRVLGVFYPGKDK